MDVLKNCRGRGVGVAVGTSELVLNVGQSGQESVERLRSWSDDGLLSMRPFCVQINFNAASREPSEVAAVALKGAKPCTASATAVTTAIRRDLNLCELNILRR